jgi:hypothetical protein
MLFVHILLPLPGVISGRYMNPSRECLIVIGTPLGVPLYALSVSLVESGFLRRLFRNRDPSTTGKIDAKSSRSIGNTT